MFGIRLMFLLAVMGGVIAFIADKLGSKIGKKKLTVFGLRPHDTSVLLTVLSGVLISLISVLILDNSLLNLSLFFRKSRLFLSKSFLTFASFPIKSPNHSFTTALSFSL